METVRCLVWSGLQFSIFDSGVACHRYERQRAGVPRDWSLPLNSLALEFIGIAWRLIAGQAYEEAISSLSVSQHLEILHLILLY